MSPVLSYHAYFLFPASLGHISYFVDVSRHFFDISIEHFMKHKNPANIYQSVHILTK